MTIIDTHAHLDHVENLDQALENARQCGVESIITVGEDLASNEKNLEIKKATISPRIYAAFGMHPGSIKFDEIESCLEFIRENIKEAIAIGEIGLDFWYKWVRKDQAKKDEQRSVFRKLLELAKDADLPAIIHTRGTWRESFEIAKATGIKRAVFHWYSGPADVLADIIATGYFVSASPSLAYSPQAREAIERAPVENILIETDSPVFYRDKEKDDAGFVAQPKDVLRTLETLSELKNLEREHALGILNNNAKHLFGIT